MTSNVKPSASALTALAVWLAVTPGPDLVFRTVPPALLRILTFEPPISIESTIGLAADISRSPSLLIDTSVPRTLHVRRNSACQLRTRRQSTMLCHEYVAVKARDPLLALRRHSQVAQPVADKRLYRRSEKPWIALYEISGIGDTHLLRGAGLLQFVEESVQFAGVV